MGGVHTGIVAVRWEALDRWIQLGMASGQVINVDFPTERPTDAVEEHPLADRVRSYLAQDAADDFADVEIALTVPTDHRRIYETLREVQYGRELSLDEFVGAVPIGDDDEEAAATVRDALRANPIPLIVPEHRIADASGATPGDVRAALREIEGLS